RWGRELSDEIIPTEANLEADVVDFAKGCYIGQEVISRIKMSGQTNKRLCGLITTAESPLRARMRLTSTDAKEVGVITSAAKSWRTGAQIGLAFLKRGHQEPGTQLMADNSVAVQIAALPFI
ncbi:MAG TPA: glycine cleavage T C-terminal barrel domain-containing protein, partial [Chthoniobacterales bacterium]